MLEPENQKSKMNSLFHTVPSYYSILESESVQLFTTPWTIACLALLSIEFSRQECGSGFSISFSMGSS